jgi:hypothetical protein
MQADEGEGREHVAHTTIWYRRAYGRGSVPDACRARAAKTLRPEIDETKRSGAIVRWECSSCTRTDAKRRLIRTVRSRSRDGGRLIREIAKCSRWAWHPRPCGGRGRIVQIRGRQSQRPRHASQRRWARSGSCQGVEPASRRSKQARRACAHSRRTRRFHRSRRTGWCCRRRVRLLRTPGLLQRRPLLTVPYLLECSGALCARCSHRSAPQRSTAC